MLDVSLSGLTFELCAETLTTTCLHIRLDFIAREQFSMDADEQSDVSNYSDPLV